MESEILTLIKDKQKGDIFTFNHQQKHVFAVINKQDTIYTYHR